MAKRYDDDDDDDLPPVKKKEPLSGMDGFFGNTNIVVLVIFGFCCSGIALILGIIGLVTCKDPKAKSNATIVCVIGGIMVVVWTVLNIVGRGMQH